MFKFLFSKTSTMCSPTSHWSTQHFCLQRLVSLWNYTNRKWKCRVLHGWEERSTLLWPQGVLGITFKGRINTEWITCKSGSFRTRTSNYDCYVLGCHDPLFSSITLKTFSPNSGCWKSANTNYIVHSNSNIMGEVCIAKTKCFIFGPYQSSNL